MMVEECRRMGFVAKGDRFLALLGRHATRAFEGRDVSSMHVLEVDSFLSADGGATSAEE